MLSRDYFSDYLKQHDEKTLFSANCIIEVHMANIVKELKFNWCSSDKVCIVLSYSKFHSKKTWFIMAIPYLQRRLFRSSNMQKSLLNLLI